MIRFGDCIMTSWIRNVITTPWLQHDRSFRGEDVIVMDATRRECRCCVRQIETNRDFSHLFWSTFAIRRRPLHDGSVNSAETTSETTEVTPPWGRTKVNESQDDGRGRRGGEANEPDRTAADTAKTGMRIVDRPTASACYLDLISTCWVPDRASPIRAASWNDSRRSGNDDDRLAGLVRPSSRSDVSLVSVSIRRTDGRASPSSILERGPSRATLVLKRYDIDTERKREKKRRA